MRVSVTINGTTHEHDVEPRLLLVHYLRETVGLSETRLEATGFHPPSHR